MEEPEKHFLWNSHSNFADKSCSDKLQITIQAYKCSSAPSLGGFEVQSSLMKRCDWKQKKIWNAFSSKPAAITHYNKTSQITLLATFLYPLLQYQEYRVSHLTDSTVQNECNSFLSLLINNYSFKSWQERTTEFQADGRSSKLYNVPWNLMQQLCPVKSLAMESSSVTSL